VLSNTEHQSNDPAGLPFLVQSSGTYIRREIA